MCVYNTFCDKTTEFDLPRIVGLGFSVYKDFHEMIPAVILNYIALLHYTYMYMPFVDSVFI